MNWPAFLMFRAQPAEEALMEWQRPRLWLTVTGNVRLERFATARQPERQCEEQPRFVTEDIDEPLMIHVTNGHHVFEARDDGYAGCDCLHWLDRTGDCELTARADGTP